MDLVYGHPFTISADLLENGTSMENVKFIGIERFGNIGIILEFIQALFV